MMRSPRTSGVLPKWTVPTSALDDRRVLPIELARSHSRERARIVARLVERQVCRGRSGRPSASVTIIGTPDSRMCRDRSSSAAVPASALGSLSAA